MEINYSIAAVVLLIAIVVIVLMIRRNKKDEKDFENTLNDSDIEPDHHKDVKPQ